MIRIQTQNFDINEVYEYCSRDKSVGAVNIFVGRVRDMHGQLHQFELEHYPLMAQKCLTDIAKLAQEKFDLINYAIVHRYGILQAGDPIVCCAAASIHRQAAIDGCAMMMDFLKTQAPFWKRETTLENGLESHHWVRENANDLNQTDRWKK